MAQVADVYIASLITADDYSQLSRFAKDSTCWTGPVVLSGEMIEDLILEEEI